MAHIDKRPNGSYRIKVFCGYSADGKAQKNTVNDVATLKT